MYVKGLAQTPSLGPCHGPKFNDPRPKTWEKAHDMLLLLGPLRGLFFFEIAGPAEIAGLVLINGEESYRSTLEKIKEAN